MEGLSIDWAAFAKAGSHDVFMELLGKLPRTEWKKRNNASGSNLLHFACADKNEAAVSALLAHGVCPDIPNQCGYTAVHMAVVSETPSILKMLCDAGADLRLCTFSGNTPIDYALRNNDDECVRILIENGVPLSCARDDDDDSDDFSSY